MKKPVRKQQEDPLYFTVAQAAALLGVCEATIKRWINSRDLKGCRFGKRILRVEKDDVHRMKTAMTDSKSSESVPSDL
jgi:excisionase family DNA binding protein